MSSAEYQLSNPKPCVQSTDMPNFAPQDGLSDTQAAREKRRRQNKNAQRNHRLRKAAQKAMASPEQISHPETSIEFRCELESTCHSRVGSLDTFSDLPRSRDHACQIHNAYIGHDDRVKFYDTLCPEGFPFNIDGSKQTAVTRFGGHAKDIFTDDTPSFKSLNWEIPSMIPSSSDTLFSAINDSCQKQKEGGQFAIHMASKGGFASIIHVLLKNGAKTELVDEYGRTALHYAVESSHVESIKVLLHWGANPSAIDSSGLSSLHIAVSKGCYSVVCLLMDHGVDPNLGFFQINGESRPLRLIQTE